jgi:hypothetical protein
VFGYISGKPAVFYPSSFTIELAQMVTIPPGETINNIEIVVPSSVEAGSISGTILDRFGSVDTSLYVYIQGTDGTNFSQNFFLDQAGQYFAENLFPGTYLVALNESNSPYYYYGNTFFRAMATKIVLDGERLRVSISWLWSDRKRLSASSGTRRRSCKWTRALSEI